jgi:YjbE family integral membrane protein
MEPYLADLMGLVHAWMGGMSPAKFWTALGEIMLLNLILSGDNAVVIALACRSLAPRQRILGILLGAVAAVVLRVAFTGFVATLMQLPWLKVIGGLALLWIAIKLLVQDAEGGKDIDASTTVWGAVRIVAIADLVMSLDNVLAIAAAAKGNYSLIIIGLAVSVPIIVFGATLVMWMVARLPLLLWAGAALLGWIAGELAVGDPGLHQHAVEAARALAVDMHTLEALASGTGAMLVLLMGWMLRRRHAVV